MPERVKGVWGMPSSLPSCDEAGQLRLAAGLRRAASVVAAEGGQYVERARQNACDNQLNNLAFYQFDPAC